jgi:hypothetical protein
MGKSKSRVQKTRLRAPDPERVTGLLVALNDEWRGSMKGDRSAVDPRALLVLVKRLQVFETIMRDSSTPLFWYANDGKVVDSPDIMRALRAVNITLRRYAATPVILPDYMTDLNGRNREWQMNWRRNGRGSQPFMEVGIALTMIELASEGRIRSLKQCEDCRRWLYAKFPHQRFCSEACKESFHSSNEVDKKRRREWAKANYQSRKNLESGSIAATKFRRTKKAK